MNVAEDTIHMPEPFFLQGGMGDVFALYFPARREVKGSLLYIPPFAEEMNRCRAAVAHQARRLNEQGYACLLLDPYGTGDSQGELVDASWDAWLKDIISAADWLTDKTGTEVTLWGFRLGALLAADAANAYPDNLKRLLLWQPVIDGKMFLTQYLRLRVAFLMDRGLPAKTTGDMRQALQDGNSLEIAGYIISGQLATGLDSKKLSAMDNLKDLKVDWFEHVAEAGKPITMVSQKNINRLEENGCEVNTHPFTGAPIWQLHKRDEVPELIEATTKLFQDQQ
jgi:exosortase A-associated hydrolase 2